MTTVDRDCRGTARVAASQHASQDEATDRLYWLLMRVDPQRTVAWGEVERRAIARAPHDPSEWRLAEGAELERIVAELRLERIDAA